MELTTSPTITEVCPILIVQLRGTFTVVAVIAPTIINPSTDADFVRVVINPELKIWSINDVP